MQTRTAYHWDPQTRVYVATSEELPSPEEQNVYYPPGYATFDAPPTIPAGKRAVRNSANTAWVLEPIPAPAPEPAQPELTDAQKQARLDRAIQRRLDDGARAWGYESLDRAATYVPSTVAKWAAEASALVAWRDATWQAAQQIQTAVKAGTRPIPTEVQLLSELPGQPTRPNP